MRQPPSTRDSNLFETKDRQIVIMLLALGVNIERIESVGRRKRFYFLKTVARPYLDLWNRGKPIPLSDIRQVFHGEMTFNAAIHDEI
jgi:hypothetical protein